MIEKQVNKGKAKNYNEKIEKEKKLKALFAWERNEKIKGKQKKLSRALNYPFYYKLESF